jgi:hypothetical protein
MLALIKIEGKKKVKINTESSKVFHQGTYRYYLTISELQELKQLGVKVIFIGEQPHGN